MTRAELKKLGRSIRIETLKMISRSNSSHIGGAFSMADILAVLYGHVLRVDPQNPRWEQRDRFLLSKGHACASLYAVLALRDFFDIKELETYAKDGSIFTSHASHKVPGVELSTGSLGHALPVACGMALAAKRHRQSWRVFVVLSDGELNEGSNWESILFAPHHCLDNLVVVVDYNKIQSLGTVKEVLDIHPIEEKFQSFGWDTLRVDGHDCNALMLAFEKLPTTLGKPLAIIADTIKGKGVDFMENELLWHYKTPSEEQFAQALAQLEKES